jgi:hypothetical protein
MSLSKWEKYDLEDKIMQILDIQSYDPDHHFGRPFLTAYQIAILFKNMFPETFARLNTPRGGKGTGVHHSLAQYLARSLSQRINKGLLPNIEGRFLHMSHIGSIQYNDFGDSFEASNLSDMSMFRLKDQ